MAILPIGISGEGQYTISRSLRFNSADSAYLNRTFSTGNRKTWTWSAWVKRSGLSTEQFLFGNYNATVGGAAGIRFESDNTLTAYNFVGSYQLQKTTTQVFRDVSSWYHIVFALDTTQATASNRAKLYVNGVQVTAFSTSTDPSLNYDGVINYNDQHELGAVVISSAGSFLNGYLTEVNFIDGQALTPSSFGETDAVTGVWKPKKYTGTYGTNGFYLNFSDNSGVTSTTLGKDSSGNGNNWTPNNFSVTAGAGNDSLVDVPTLWGSDTGAGGEVRGNYATLNVLRNNTSNALSNGNLDVTSTTGAFRSTLTTIGVSSGKWYWEVLCNTISGTNNRAIIGIGTAALNKDSAVGSSVFGYGYYSENGNKFYNDTFTSFGNSYQSGDVIGFALNMDAGTCVVYKNNVSQGTLASSLTGEWFPAVGILADSGTSSISCNFGQRPFAYTAPSGFKALCTQNLPEPTIKQGDDYFNAVLYTGNNTARTISGVGFQPDFVWAKVRSSTQNHQLYDSVRGATKILNSNGTGAEYTDTLGLTGFVSDGFTLGADTTNNDINANTKTYVAWNWKANGAGVTNTAGTITSTVSANTTSGFSVVKWASSSASDTIGHGLGVQPAMIIAKETSISRNWFVYHKSLGNNYYLHLNATNAALTPNAGRLEVRGSDTFICATDGTNQVAYCFAPVAGFSAFGSYTGNGSTDGPFVFTGFRPKFILHKCSSLAGDGWLLYDTVRQTYNVVGAYLQPNLSDAEGNTTVLDILSNGFKLRSTFSSTNANGATYIYAAFAESPFKNALAR